MAAKRPSIRNSKSIGDLIAQSAAASQPAASPTPSPSDAPPAVAPQAPTPAPEVAAQHIPTTRKTKRIDTRKSRPSAPPSGTRSMSLYLPTELYRDMRDAYVWDLDHRNEPETSLARWIGRALRDHAQRTPTQRSKITQERPPAQTSGDDGHTARTYHLPQNDVAAMTSTIESDRAAGRPYLSRSAYAADAVWAAVEAARATAPDGRLPHREGRLPNQPLT